MFSPGEIVSAIIRKRSFLNIGPMPGNIIRAEGAIIRLIVFGADRTQYCVNQRWEER